jgi:hypothetical protein
MSAATIMLPAQILSRTEEGYVTGVVKEVSVGIILENVGFTVGAPDFCRGVTTVLVLSGI